MNRDTVIGKLYSYHLKTTGGLYCNYTNGEVRAYNIEEAARMAKCRLDHIMEFLNASMPTDAWPLHVKNDTEAYFSFNPNDLVVSEIVL